MDFAETSEALRSTSMAYTIFKKAKAIITKAPSIATTFLGGHVYVSWER